eukprot:UN4580
MHSLLDEDAVPIGNGSGVADALLQERVGDLPQQMMPTPVVTPNQNTPLNPKDVTVQVDADPSHTINSSEVMKISRLDNDSLHEHVGGTSGMIIWVLVIVVPVVVCVCLTCYRSRVSKVETIEDGPDDLAEVWHNMPADGGKKGPRR